MVPVKIECQCGQKYAFDVEPVNGKMPSAVNCPGCGAEGTAAANDFISHQLAVVPAPAATFTATASPPRAQAPMRLARAQSEPAGVSPAVAPDDTGRDKLVREAKAKMTGGDSMEQVAAFLTVKGFDRAEAMELARGFYKERAKIVRSNGIKKTIVGFVLMLVPLGAYLSYKDTGRLRIRASLWAYGVGIFGAYMFVSGIIMVLAPKSEKGIVVKE
jgi:hypothetical protein